MDGLARRVREAALLEGDFVLSSGVRSRFYVDKYRFSTEPGLLQDISANLADRLPEGVDRLAGVELGAVPLVVALALETGLPYVIVRKTTKDYGTGRRVEGELRSGERVALVEDVVTTGTQALKAVRSLQEAGAEVLRVLAVLDRREAAGSGLGGVPFESLLRLGDLGLEPER